MITYSIIQKSQLEGAQRLDAEYFQPDYLELERKMGLLNLPQLKDLDIRVDASAFYPSIAEYYGDKGVPFVRVADVLNLQLAEDGLLFLPDKIVKQHKTLHIGLPGDIIITKGGTVGNIAILPDKYPKYALSRDIIFIKTSKLSKEQSITILLFLASSFGLFQLIRGASLQVQPHLTLPLIRNLHIPHKIIESAVNGYYESLDQMQKSKDYYFQAENLLLKELGLKDVVFKEDLSYVVNYSDIISNNRIDPEYFQPKYQKLIEKIKRQNAKTLGELVSMKKGFEPGSEAYQESGKLFIRVSSISKLGIEEKDQKYLSEELYQKLRKDYEPKLGDILLTKDAVPGIAYVIKEPLEGIISGGVLDLKVKDKIESEYLALCISSIVGQWQAQRDAGGSIISHWKPEQVKNLIIPILPTGKQKEIAELVRKSHTARKKSKELLEEAKRKVEQMIEKQTN